MPYAPYRKGNWLIGNVTQGEPIVKGVQRIKHVMRVSKFIYDQYMEARAPPEQTVITMWERKLHTQIDPEKWSRLYQSAMRYTKSTKHRYFQYRLLNKRITTNVHRSKWDEDVSPLCYFCNEHNKTVLHLLYECSKCQGLN